MKTAGTVIAIALIVVAAFGVLSGREWMDNSRTQTEIRANADISIARIEAEADIEESRQATQRTALWTQAAPIGLLILVIGVGAWIVLWWRGRLYLAQIETAAGLRPDRQIVAPPEVRRLASERQAQPVLVDGQWALVRDNAIVAWVRPQLTGPQ
jgi:hypothetical protein